MEKKLDSYDKAWVFTFHYGQILISALVKVWVSLIMAGTYTIQQCPTFFNLRNSVEEVLKELTEENKETHEEPSLQALFLR